MLGWTEATATPQVEVALQHPKMTLIANALVLPRRHDQAHSRLGPQGGALCGSPSQARKHADAGVDIIIAQGGEAGGHSGEVGSIVLWRRSSRKSPRYRCWRPVVLEAVSRSQRRWRWCPRRVDRFPVADG